MSLKGESFSAQGPRASLPRVRRRRLWPQTSAPKLLLEDCVPTRALACDEPLMYEPFSLLSCCRNLPFTIAAATGLAILLLTAPCASSKDGPVNTAKEAVHTAPRRSQTPLDPQRGIAGSTR